MNEYLKSQLEAARQQIKRLRAENVRLRKKLKLPPEEQSSQKLANEKESRTPELIQETLPLMNQDAQENQPASVNNDSPPKGKIAFPRIMFRGGRRLPAPVGIEKRESRLFAGVCV